MKAAYNQLHRLGYAHSVEVWEGDRLVGGVYGVALGRVFFGESMFSEKTNASKLALLRFSEFLSREGFVLFDCQVASDHLFSLGACTISRGSFEQIIFEACHKDVIEQMQPTWQAANKKLISDDGHLLD